MYQIQLCIIILTFHEARLKSLVCQCDCIYCVSVTAFILPVWLHLLYLCDCIYFANVTVFTVSVRLCIVPVWLHLFCQFDCIYFVGRTTLIVTGRLNLLWYYDCIRYASVSAFILLVVLQLMCQYDCLCFVSGNTFIVPLWLYFRHCDLTYWSISVLVTEWLLFLCQRECACTSANALVLPYDCICFVSVTAIVQYDYTIFTATLLLQGHARRNDSWYRACSNHVMNVHGQITIQSYSKVKCNSDHSCVGRGGVPMPSFLPLLHGPHLCLFL